MVLYHNLIWKCLNYKTKRFTLFHHETPNKKECKQVALNHSSDIEFKDFVKLNEDFIKEPISFLVNDTTLWTDNPLEFMKNLL